jgi:hypothetical protein
MVQSPMRNSCGTKKNHPKGEYHHRFLSTGFSLSRSVRRFPCRPRSAERRRGQTHAADPAPGPYARQSRRRRQCSRAGCRRSIPGPWRWRRAERPGFQASSPVRCRAHLQRPTPCGFVDETWMANGATLRRVSRPASKGPLSTLQPYQEDSHRRVEYRRSTKVDKTQGQAWPGADSARRLALHNLRRSTAQK